MREEVRKRLEELAKEEPWLCSRPVAESIMLLGEEILLLETEIYNLKRKLQRSTIVLPTPPSDHIREEDIPPMSITEIAEIPATDQDYWAV